MQVMDRQVDECDGAAAAGNARRGWLAAHLLRQSRERRSETVGSRFLLFCQRLRGVGRQRRRALWRKSATRVAAALTGTALLLALSRAPAQAANITVEDGVVAIAADGDCSLREAIINANNGDQTYSDCVGGDVGADTIILPLNDSFTVSDFHEDFQGYTGLPVIAAEITIEGNGSTIQMDAAAIDDFRLLAVNSTGDLTIDDLTIQDFSLDSSGGAIRVSDGILEINYSVLQNNVSSYRGGAIFSIDGEVTIANTILDENEADSGGGIATSRSILTITDSVISNNNAYFDGGGLDLYQTTTEIRRTTISGNEANESGGGIESGPGSITIFQSAITDNVTEGDGGGIALNRLCECGSDNVTVIVNSTFSGNYARYGGGIHVGSSGLYGGEINITLTNVTISDNLANESGGGLYAYEGDGSLSLNRTLIAGNRSTNGTAELDAPDTTTANNYNLIGHNVITNVQAFSNFIPGATDITSTSNGTEPKALGAILNGTLALNGATTQTHALVGGSPAIDRAPDVDCNAPSLTDGVDQRDVARNQDGDGTVATGNECDIGAYEYVFVPLGECTNEITNILGVGMGDKKKVRKSAKINIPNSVDLVSLYGQLVGKEVGRMPNYVHFIYLDKSFVRLDDPTGTSARHGGIFWYGTDLEPSARINAKWFLLKKTPPTQRAFILYPTYETEAFYVNAFATYPVGAENTIGPMEPWTQSQTLELPIDTTLTTVDITVQIAVVDNDKDTRPVTVRARAGTASAENTSNGPTHGNLLNIITLTLEDVPAGVDMIYIDLETPLDGESAAVVGATAHYLCETG